jgi:hypothetical protein
MGCADLLDTYVNHFSSIRQLRAHEAKLPLVRLFWTSSLKIKKP